MSDDARNERPGRVSLALFAGIAVLIGSDLIADYGEGSGTTHLLVEALALLFACAGAMLLWRRLQRAHSSVHVLQSDLAAARTEASRWRRENDEILRGLGAAIEEQFRRWELSAAEKEVALLMLKGLSHKEIADLRTTSERTVREQARTVYRKSGVSGRAALSAFFLEDLLLPAADGTAGSTS
jgi:DNA-binding NarL/FixJ family response regulator